MEMTLPVLVGICVATMFFGYIFGLIEGRGQGYKKRKKEEELDLNAQLPPEERAPGEVQTSTEAQAPAEAPPVMAAPQTDVLALHLDEKGMPQLDLDGKHVEATSLAPDQRRRLVDLLVMMRPWVDGTAAKTAAPSAPPPAPAARPVARTAPPSPPAAPRVEPAPPSAADRFRVATGAVQPAKAQPPTSAGDAADAPAPVPMSMVAQIDAILQSRMIGTPLAELGVRLAESLNGGVTVFVGKDRYAGVGDVPSSEIQAAIRGAIAEWEKKYTPS
jgi:hypothetical protein